MGPNARPDPSNVASHSPDVPNENRVRMAIEPRYTQKSHSTGFTKRRRVMELGRSAPVIFVNPCTLTTICAVGAASCTKQCVCKGGGGGGGMCV